VGLARQRVAALFGAAPHEVIFTGGGSEANNLAIKGIASKFGAPGDQLICSAVEHPSVAESHQFLVRQGYRLTIVPVDRDGRVDPAHVAAALTGRTILVSIMHANNEVGTLQPIRAIAHLVHARGGLLHTDAAQTVGKVPVTRDMLDADLISIAGHKFSAPMGVGALIVRSGIQLERGRTRRRTPGRHGKCPGTGRARGGRCLGGVPPTGVSGPDRRPAR